MESLAKLKVDNIVCFPFFDSEVTSSQETIKLIWCDLSL